MYGKLIYTLFWTLPIYLFISRKKNGKYESKQKLYKDSKAQNLEQKPDQRLIMLLVAVIEIITNLFENTDNEKLFRKIINSNEAFEKIKLLINSPQKNILNTFVGKTT